MKKFALILSIFALFLGCEPENTPDDPECECPNGTDHWEGAACCTNNDGAKTDDCNCNTVAVAGGEHTEGTVRYKGDNEHAGCQVMFNGELVRRNGDNCEWMDGSRPVIPECECKDIDHWSDEPCCTNNGGAKTDDCNCNTVAVASGEHLAFTPRYEGQDDDCYVMFNGKLELRKWDNCVDDGPPPVDTYGDIGIFAGEGVDAATATAKAADFNTAMAGPGVNDEVKAYITAKVSRVEIVAGVSTVTLDNGVLRVGANRPALAIAGGINTCIADQPDFELWKKDNGFAKAPVDSKVKIAHNWQRGHATVSGTKFA